MKKSVYLHLAAMSLMVSAMSGCQDMESLSHSDNIHVVKASIENRTTRVGLSQGDASLDMIAQWQSDDQINILINGGSNTYDVGLVPIQDLSANGKSCTFQYAVPKDLNGASGGYQLNCFTSNCSPKEQGGDFYCDASLVRAPISQFKARIMATQHVDAPDCTAAFRHYGTYEVLHFTNNTDHDITFSLCGFKADNLWYTEGGCALRLSDNSYVADPSYETVAESPAVTIPAQGTETIVSWYVPNGKKIENAAIVAAINGNRITSSNSINSDVTFTIGNAYHVYAAWDGKEMRFARGNVSSAHSINVTPTEIDFGIVEYGSDKTETFTVKNIGNTSFSFYVPQAARSEQYFEVSDAGIEFTLSPGESKEYTVTCHGLQKGYKAWVDFKIISDSEDDKRTVRVNSVGWDSTPLLETNSLTLMAGEGKSIEMHGSNIGTIEIVNNNPDIVSAEKGGDHGGMGTIGRSDGRYSHGFTHLDISALAPGIAIVKVIDTGTNEEAIVTVTVTDGSTSDIPAEAVDLGLPSGTLWASWNVGATKPEEVGGYYAWGETETKNNYEWSNYQHCSGGRDALHDIGSNISNTEYDAASVKWGDGWRMPTLTQWKEVIANCTMTKTTLNGVDCVELVSRNNGNSIFLPATGCRWDNGTYYADDVYCWLADLASAGSAAAYYLTIQGNGMGYGRDHERYVGMPIRPVRPSGK